MEISSTLYTKKAMMEEGSWHVEACWKKDLLEEEGYKVVEAYDGRSIQESNKMDKKDPYL